MLKTVFNTVFTMTVAVLLAGASVVYAYSDYQELPATSDLIDRSCTEYPAVLTSQEPSCETQVILPLTNLIDQNQPDNSAYMAQFSQLDLAQSFQQTHGNISGAGIELCTGTGDSDTVIISLWDSLPNAGGTKLAEASGMGTAGSWIDVFWTPVIITPATTYYLVFTGNTTLGIYGSESNPYPHGNVYANSGFQPFPNFDFTFRTYYDDQTPIERNTWASVKSLFN